ncbi:MAG: thiamine ABC transporter substrate-binding protein [Treponema sp.]|jgi:thiamine transport system substrate-binding protein|nr:thiamine ABC transporter substrate-binding protein [Treponema sp.]
MNSKTATRIAGLAAALLGVFPVFARGSRDAQNSAAQNNEVVVWTYDSFNSEWGSGPGVAARFFEETGIRVRWVSHGDAGTMLSRLLLEDGAGADIILGLDQNLAGRALASGLLEACKPTGAEKIFPELVVDQDFRLIPFDYSYFAIIYDSEAVPVPPQSLEDLTAPSRKNSLILMDPRTSSPGLGFLAWTKAAYGPAWAEYWQRLAPSILTVAESWDTGYGLFTAGEAPLALSYSTSPGYHLEYEKTERYKAALFTEGHPVQIELAGLLAGAKNKANARRFLDFMLTPSFQDSIPLTNWMYPVIDIPLPASYRINTKPGKTLKTEPVTSEELNRWAAVLKN